MFTIPVTNNTHHPVQKEQRDNRENSYPKAALLALSLLTSMNMASAYDGFVVSRPYRLARDSRDYDRGYSTEFDRYNGNWCGGPKNQMHPEIKKACENGRVYHQWYDPTTCDNTYEESLCTPLGAQIEERRESIRKLMDKRVDREKDLYKAVRYEVNDDSSDYLIKLALLEKDSVESQYRQAVQEQRQAEGQYVRECQSKTWQCSSKYGRNAPAPKYWGRIGGYY